MSCDGSLDTTHIRYDLSADNSQVSFPDRSLCELLGQSLMGDIVFGNYKTTTGILIQAMHDPGTFHTASSALLR